MTTRHRIIALALVVTVYSSMMVHDYLTARRGVSEYAASLKVASTSPSFATKWDRRMKEEMMVKDAT